jgi:2-polyprenyl-6-methoxyphenol hydroxylase-like FAD-dependent oxidoreductase
MRHMATYGQRGRRTDVLVVGAGPVGLTLAMGLVTHGLKVRVVDREREANSEPRAAVIWPRGAEALDDLGAGERVRAAANELQTLDLHSRGRALGRVSLGSLDSRYPHSLLIEQDATERLLSERLRELGTEVERGVEAVEIRPDADGVETVLRGTDGRAERAASAWLVGCDGSRSTVRESLGIPFEGRRRRNLQLLQVDAVPHWRHSYDPSRGFYFIAPDACLGCFPRPDGGYRFFCYTTDPDPAIADPPSLDEMRDLVARVAGTPELRLTEHTWLNRARFQQRFAARLRAGRVLLAGDAAHVWASIGGHGMNVGLRGAHNLAWKLAAVHRGEARPALLDTYETEERTGVKAFLRLMKLNFLEYPTTRLGFLPREVLLRAGLATPRLAPLIERAVSDLDAGHGRSPLSRAAKGVRGLRPGDRAPDAPVVAEGRETTLHRLLSYACWTLLVADSIGAEELGRLRAVVAGFAGPIAVRPVSVPDGGDLAPLARERLILLIRPDRHVGLVARIGDVAALRAYLADWFHAGPARAQAPRAESAPPDRASVAG